ncbi:MAG: gas vesicle protein [Phycisphaerales bacterium]|nr:gas vesicle protein [Phycisphaerales bacterium]
MSTSADATSGTVIDPSDVDGQRHLSLCEALDRLLHKGVVIRGEVAISVANVELLYLGLQVLLASTDTARKFLQHDATARAPKELAP